MRKAIMKSTALAAAIFSLSSLSLAQLEEVIVTAQKREQSLQDVPMAITAISGQLLENNEINSITDLTKMVPSLKYTPGDNPQNSSIRVRGVGTDVFSSAVEPNVSVVLDNVPLARTSLINFDFADVERVEVLRGPQGTLFGKNASAGLIHVITRDPHSEFEARARYTFETPDEFHGNYHKFQASLSGPLTDTLGARITVYQKDVEGHIEDLAFDDYLPDQESKGARIKLRWDASDALALTLIAEQQDSDGESFPMVPRSASPAVEQNNDPITASETNRQTRTVNGSESTSDIKAYTLIADWDIGAFVISSVTGYREADLFNNLSINALDGVNINVDYGGGPRSIETFTQELRLSSQAYESLEFTVGALWFDNALSNQYDRRVSDIPATAAASIYPETPLDLPLNIGSIDQEGGFANTIDTENLGIFGQGTWHITDRLHLTMGLRHIDESLTASYSSYSHLRESATGLPLSAADSSVSVPHAEVSDTALTGTFSVQYDWGEHSMVYATYSRGYRGRAFDVVSSSSAESFERPVKAETADSYELGVKSRFFDSRVELNVTAFQTIFTDFQAQIIDASNGGFTGELRLDNAGELETKGVEIDFKAKPIEPLMIFGSILYNEAVFNEFMTQCFSGQGPNEAGGRDTDNDGSCDANDVSGGVLTNAPELSGSITTRYDWAIGDAGRSLYAQLTGRYQSEVQFQADQHPGTKQDAYDVWDLRLGYLGIGGRFEMAAYVKNLFQQSYVNAMITIPVTQDRRDVMHVLPRDADRIFGLSLSYQW